MLWRYRVEGSRSRVSGQGYQVKGIGSRVSCQGYQVNDSGQGFRSRVQVKGIRSRVSSQGVQVKGIRSMFRSRVSGQGYIRRFLPHDEPKPMMKTQIRAMTARARPLGRVPDPNPSARMIEIATSATIITTPPTRSNGLRPQRSTAPGKEGIRE